MIRALSYFLLIIFALAMAIFYWGASVVEKQQESITSWVSLEAGYPIEIAEIKLSWVDISPQLEFKTIKVMAKDNSAELLSLETLYLDLNVFSSLWFANFMMDEVTAVGLNLTAARDSNGEFYIQGLKQNSDSTTLFSDIIKHTNKLNSFNLKAVNVNYDDQQQVNLSGRYQIERATLSHSASSWHANGQVSLPTSLGDNFEFSTNWRLNQQNTKLMTWQGIIKTNNVLISPLSPYLNWNNITLEKGLFNSIITVEGLGLEVREAKLDIELSHAMLASKEIGDVLKPIDVEYFKGNFLWKDQGMGDSWLFSGNDINLSIKGEVWPETSLTVIKNPEEVMIKSDFFRIEHLLDVAALSGLLSEQILLQNPAGDIEKLEMTYLVESGLKYASLNLIKGQVTSWNDYPGITNLYANINFSEEGARFKIASKKVTVHPANKFDSLMFF